MTPTDLFVKLGAPLRNLQWSWGAVRPSDGAVFLRVWQDEDLRMGDKTLMRLTNRRVSEARQNDHGYEERLSQIELIRAGAACYLIMSVAQDPKALPRKIKSFDSKSLFRARAPIELEGDTWIELGTRVDVSAVTNTRLSGE